MLRSKRFLLSKEVYTFDDLVEISLDRQRAGCDIVGIRLDLYHVLNNRIEVVSKWQRESEVASHIQLPSILCQLKAAAEKQAAQTFVYPCPCGDANPEQGITAMCIWVDSMGATLGCVHIYFSPGPKKIQKTIEEWEQNAPYLASVARQILLQHWVENLPQIVHQERESAVENERRQIVRRLHDTVAHELACLLLKVGELTEYVSSNHDPIIDQGLNNLYHLVSQSNDQIRSLLASLFRQEAVHLVSGIREAANTSAKRGNFNWELYEEGEEVKLPDGVLRVILIFVREALHNIEKHAQASLARIHLCWSKGGLVVRISDNGIGFDSQKALRSDPDQKERYGLSILQKSAAELDASLIIDSEIGAGTEVVLKMPLSEAPYPSILGEMYNPSKLQS